MAAVCFFWGTTYVGIRAALEGLSPQYLVAVRFLLSGCLILGWAWWKGWRFPKGLELAWILSTGLLTLGIGNYMLSLAETYVPSGLAALFITIGPFWMVGAEAIIPGGDKIKAKAFLAMLVGFSGAIWLIGPDGFAVGLSGGTLKGFLILQISCLAWSVGSILQKRRKSGAHPILVGGLQQLSAGLAAALICLFIPGWRAEWSPGVLFAVLYLAFFGSIVAYSAYLIALEGLPVAVVSVYTYINPIVAVCLGWLIYRESFGIREVGAMCVIFLGVFLVNRFSRNS